MANSFEVDINELDEASLSEMLRDFTPEDIVTLCVEQAGSERVVGLTTDIRWEQAAAELAVKVSEVSSQHIVRWLNWAEAVIETQSSAMDRDIDVNKLLDEDDL